MIKLYCKLVGHIWLYEFDNCKMCAGTGNITIEEIGRTIQCPKCYGRKGNRRYKARDWKLHDISSSPIGKICAEVFDDKPTKISYMIESTGIGTGALWPEDRVFSNELEAVEECDKRNEDKRED